ncbi:MAG: electron transfer flavoprotein subunit alpha/FixB family protein [Actinomycetales bacterium]|nr:electron transfer flavoprotein subunit alpha/FixB family protein [Actinomycetales bacterium]
MIAVLLDQLDSTAEADLILVRLAAAVDEVTCLLGSAPDRDRVAALGAAGASHLAWADLAPDGPSGPWVAALAALVGPDDAVLAPSTRAGNEVAARLALRLGRPLSVGADSIAVGGPGLVVTSTAFTATWHLTTELPKASVVTAVSAGVQVPPPTPRTPGVRRLELDLTPAPHEPVVVAAAPKAAGAGPRLTEAAVVVSGGRGTDGDFSLIEEFAGLIGAAVGSSRVAVDQGWASPERQVGQTGVSVAPEVYIAAGISGAVQHLAGMVAAKQVVAINTDPDAPIFRACDLGIVGDLHTVLADAVAAVRKAQPVHC